MNCQKLYRVLLGSSLLVLVVAMLFAGGEEPTASGSTQLPVSHRPQYPAAPPPSEIKVERLERLSDDDLKVVVSVTLDRAAARAYIDCSILDNNGGLIRAMTISFLNLTAGRKTDKDRVAHKVAGAKSATCRLAQIVPQTNADSQAPSSVARSAESELPALGTKKNDFGIVITIDKTEQKMTVSVDGVQQDQWPVSTGRLGYSTPSGTFTATSMNKIWYSKQWNNAPMPHSIFFMKDGHAIHGSSEVKSLGKPMSHGCVRISPQNAARLYALVENSGLENTQVVLTGITPGGESNFEAGGLGFWGFGP